MYIINIQQKSGDADKMQAIQTRSKRIDSLQALRALAFLGVFALHCEETSYTGAWGVSVFFILSGAMMVYQYNTRELGTSLRDCLRFSLSKIKKLYPLHLITTLLFFLFENMQLLASPTLTGWLKELGKLSLHATLLQAWVPVESLISSYHGPSWYLCATMFVYACFPWIMSAIRKWNNKKTLCAAAAVFALQWAVALAVHKLIPSMFSWACYHFPLYRLGDFFIGCCVGKCLLPSLETEKQEKAGVFTLLEAAVLALTFAAFRVLQVVGGDWLFRSSIFTPVTAAAVALFALKRGVFTRILSNRVFVALGDISAYTYLLHGSVIVCLTYFINGFTGHSFSNVSLLIFTIVLASAYQMLENRIRARR